MGVIRAKRYDKVVQELMDDPIIQDMAKSLTGLSQTDLTGHGFMMASMDEYKKRDGNIEGHIGAVSEALRAVLEKSNI